MSLIAGFFRLVLTLSLCLVWAAGVVLASNNSAKAGLLVVLGSALLASLLWYTKARRRYFIGLVFLAAPFDISKAVVPPLDRFYSPGLYITVGQMAMLALGAIWLIEQVFVHRRRLPLTRLDAWAFGFMALVWLGALHAQAGGLALASAAAYSLCVIGFYIISHTLQSRGEVRLMLFMLIIGLAFQTLHVGAQMATHSFLPLPGSKVAAVGAAPVNFEAEITAFRPIGAFDHPNALADYLTLLLPSAFALVLLGAKRLPARVLTASWAVLLVGAALLLITLSRGGWAAAILGMSFVGVIYGRKHLIGQGHLVALAGLILGGLLTIVLVYPQVILRLTEPDSRSTESRLVLVDQAWTIIKDHPLIGVGYGGYNRAALEHTPPSFAFISEDYQKQLLKLVVHNHYLLLASELGIPTMLYWVFLMLQFIRQAWPLSRWQDPAMFALTVGVAGALVSQMLFLASDNYYADIRVYMLWLTAGVLQALSLQANRALALASTASGAS